MRTPPNAAVVLPPLRPARALRPGLLPALLLPLLALTPARPAAADPGAPPLDLVETAEAAGTFRSLLAAVKAAGLEQALRGAGPFTLFAPTDEAFAALPPHALAGLLEPEQRERLGRVLAYHVVAGRVTGQDLLPRASAPSLAGPALTFGLTVGGARVIAADVACSNGVIHVVDRVLLPPEAGPTPAPAPAEPPAAGAELREAIARGAPAFNAGDPAACARIYAAAAAGLLARGAVPELHVAPFEAALQPRASDADRAWELRRAFDRVLADEAFRPRLEAPLPEGFPGPGPVGRVVRKEYPAYRAARAAGGGSFWTLFGHIQRNEVRMTAPVEMTLDAGLEALDMAFLYERPTQGAAGAEGRVAVLDVPARSVLSLGLRGERSPTELARARALLEARAAREGLTLAGPLRLLAYNSPRVPAAERFSELQLPVAAR